MYASGTLARAASTLALSLFAFISVPIAAQSATGGAHESPPDAARPIRGSVRLMDDALRDATITAAVRSRLSVNTEGLGVDVDVQTRQGRVTLLGIVGSEAAQDRASLLTRQVRGVVAIDNQLMVVRDTPTLIRTSHQGVKDPSLFIWPPARYAR